MTKHKTQTERERDRQREREQATHTHTHAHTHRKQKHTRAHVSAPTLSPKTLHLHRPAWGLNIEFCEVLSTFGSCPTKHPNMNSAGFLFCDYTLELRTWTLVGFEMSSYKASECTSIGVQGSVELNGPQLHIGCMK